MSRVGCNTGKKDRKHMVKVIDGKRSLRFSNRYFLGEAIKTWMLDNKAKDCPMNAIVWLDEHRLIDRVGAQRFIAMQGLEHKNSS